MRGPLALVLWLMPAVAAADILPPPSRPEFDTPLPMPVPPDAAVMLGLAVLFVAALVCVWLSGRRRGVTDAGRTTSRA